MSGRAVGGLVAVLLAATAAPADDLADRVRIDKDRFIFGQITDEKGILPDEAQAYNTVLLHARQLPIADLEKAARRDLSFRDLFKYPKEYRFELVHFDGRLKQLRRTEPTKELADAGVTDLYEGWLFPADERNPVVFLVTELPPDLTAQMDRKADLNVRAAVAGYSFKLFRYESREPDPKDKRRNVDRLAPLLMGKSVTVLPEPGPELSAAWRDIFLPVVVGGVCLVGLVMVGFAWWFRRGDRAVREQMEQRRDANPFSE